MYTIVYCIISNAQKGMREVRGKAEGDIEGEGLDSPLRRKTGVIGSIKGVVWI
jgi:hypothetical protein